MAEGVDLKVASDALSFRSDIESAPNWQRRGHHAPLIIDRAWGAGTVPPI
jgi:hypothetical protein